MIALLVSASLFSTSASAGVSSLCRIFLEKSKAKITAPLKKIENFYHRALVEKVWDTFDFVKYDRTLQEIRQGGKPSVEDVTPETEFALLQAAVETLPGREGELSIERILRSEDWNARFALFHIIHGTKRNPFQVVWEGLKLSIQRDRNFAVGVTEWQARKVLREIYLLNNLPMSESAGMFGLFGKSFGKKAELNLDRRSEFEIREYGLRKFLREKTDLRSPTALTRLEVFLASDAGNAFLAVTSNLKLLDGYAGKAPTYTALKFNKFTVGRMYYKGGLAGLDPEVRKKLLNDSRMQLRSDAVTSALTFLGGVLTAYTAYHLAIDEEKAKDEKIMGDVITSLTNSTRVLEKRLNATEKLDFHQRGVLRGLWEYQDSHAGVYPPGDDAAWKELKADVLEGGALDSHSEASIEKSLKAAGYTEEETKKILESIR